MELWQEKLVINTTVGFSLLSRNMRSRLTGMEQVDKAENYSHVNSTRLYLISKLEYSLGKLKSYLSLPVYFYTSRYSGKTTASKEKIHQTVFESSSIRYLSFLFPMADGYYRVCQLITKW